MLQRCLICLYVVLNHERFFLHVYVIPSIALLETSANERNALPVPRVARTHTHTHSCLFFRLSERLVYNIPGCCNMTQNFIPGRREVSSEQPLLDSCMLYLWLSNVSLGHTMIDERESLKFLLVDPLSGFKRSSNVRISSVSFSPVGHGNQFL